MNLAEGHLAATTPSTLPRVRGSVWALLFACLGVAFLHFAYGRAWFIGFIGGGEYPYLKAWGTAAILFSLMATLLWGRLVSDPTWKRTLASFLFVGVVTSTMAFVYARDTLDRVGVTISDVRWDSKAQKFEIRAWAPPQIAQACRRGDLRIVTHFSAVIADTGDETVFFNSSGFSLGASELSVRPASKSKPALARSPIWNGPMVEVDPVALLWDGAPTGTFDVRGVWVRAALVDRSGNQVGRTTRAILGPTFFSGDGVLIFTGSVSGRFGR